MSQTHSEEVKGTLYLYSSLLAFKVLAMALLTAKWRLKKRVFISPEDAIRSGRVSYKDPDVERIRRSHLNDIENIPLFVLTAFIYASTGPQRFIANNLIRIYATSRFLHSYIYIHNLPQPGRAWAFRIGFAVNMYMILQSLLYYAL